MRREVRQYHRLRDDLIDLMGGKCIACGADGGPERKFHFDHPDGRSWEPNCVSSHMRIKRYIDEYWRGKLRLLCERCNTSRRYDGKILL